MEYYEFTPNGNKNSKRVNKSRCAIVATMVILIIVAIVVFSMYIGDEEFRKKIDMDILKKEITSDSESLISIGLDGNENQYICAYNKYIAILSKNILKNYNKNGKVESENSIHISNPIFESAGRFLCIAEKDGEEIYLMNETKVEWKKEVDGKIVSVSVNKNGYVAVIVTPQTTYKSVIICISPEGNELFTTFLSKTIAIDTTISNNNKYLAIVETDISGTLIKSNIKIISIEKAKKQTEEAIIYTYEEEPGSILSSIQYKDNENLICMFNDKIICINNFQSQELEEIDAKEVQFVDINVENSYIIANEKSSILNQNTEIIIKNLSNQKQSVYTVENQVEAIKTAYKKIVAISRNELYFINNTGSLIKKYTTTKKIKNVVIGDNIAGVVYNDRVDIINL